MQYATQQDLIDRFGERELIALTDPDNLAVRAERVQLALDDAQAMADGLLARVYSLPLAGCAKPAPVQGNPGAVVYVPPPQLTRAVCDVARYYLYDQLAPEHEVYIRYKAAERELQAIADGKAVLTCPWGGMPGVLLSDGGVDDSEVRFEFSPRSITDAGAGGYR